jgi:hypothetical protein
MIAATGDAATTDATTSNTLRIVSSPVNLEEKTPRNCGDYTNRS